MNMAIRELFSAKSEKKIETKKILQHLGVKFCTKKKNGCLHYAKKIMITIIITMKKAWILLQCWISRWFNGWISRLNPQNLA